MRVLVAPEIDEVPIIKTDILEAQPGEILTLFGEPCHEGIEEIRRCGCGRVFLGLQSGRRSSVGIVFDVDDAEVVKLLETSPVVKMTMLDVEGNRIPESSELEGTMSMVSAFSETSRLDLKEISQTIAQSKAGAVFGVRNSRTRCRLVWRKWAKRGDEVE